MLNRCIGSSLALSLALGAYVQTAVAACPAPAWNQAVVYTDANLQGSCAVVGVGEYPNLVAGIPNDSISSIVLGYGVKMTLYQDGGFGGAKYNYTNGPYFYNLNGWVNDDASSFKVRYRVDSTNPPPNFLASLPQDHHQSWEYYAYQTSNATSDTAATFDLGEIKAGTTIRVGTCTAGGDLPSASTWTGTDTVVRVFFNGWDVGVNDDNCGAFGSYLAYTVPYTGNVTIKAGCYGNSACGGNLEVAYGAPDSNGSIDDVVLRFNAMTGNSPRRNKLDFWQAGKVYGAYKYHIAHEPHFQGLQRVPRTLDSSPDDRPKFLLSGSDNADLYTVQFAPPTPRTDGLVGPLPGQIASETKVIGNASYGRHYDQKGRGHLGGIQASGRWLGGGIEQTSGGPSLLRFWDLSSLPNPLVVGEVLNSGAAGEVALTKLPGVNRPFIMFVGGQSKTTAQAWTLSGDFGGDYGYANLLTGKWVYRGIVTIPDPKGQGFQGLNFVNRDNGELYLVGTVGYGSTNPEAGTDTAALFRVQVRSDWTFEVTHVRSTVYICQFDGSRQCGFNAAAGVFVDPDVSALRLYASKAYRPDNDSYGMTFVEYY